MKNCNPFLRQIFLSNHLPNQFFVKSYDCRFLYVLSGSGRLITDNESFELSADTLVYYPSGIAYFPKSDKNDRLDFITVNFDFTHEFEYNSGTLRPVPVKEFDPEKEQATFKATEEKIFSSAFAIKNAMFVRNDLLRLTTVFKNKNKYNKVLCSAILKVIILETLNHFSNPANYNEPVKRTIDFINNNYTHPINNEIIAKELNYHPYYLGAVFKKHTGSTIHEYLAEVRLKSSEELLLHTESPINEIAAKCGFQNPDHFSSRFKQKYGKSPTRWRNECKFI